MANEVSEFTFSRNIWYGNKSVKVRFPKSWEVEVFHMQGFQASVLSTEQIKEKIENPIGGQTIMKGASGSKSAVILFDDMTRPTRISRIAPIVLDQLAKAGVPEDSIRFVMAQGAHRAHTRVDYSKKLGEEIVDKYPVFSHNPFHNCVRVGTTSHGTPVEINAEVMDCDYKIGIGGLVPHPQMGYGGGGKIVVPGVASMETIRKNHYLSIAPDGSCQAGVGWGHYGDNKHRLDVEEATRLAGLDFKIDAFFNYQGEITRIFAGDPVHEHREGVKDAQDYYRTKKAEGKDVILANAYCKATEAGLVLGQAPESLKEDGGTVVVISHTPEGLAAHYLYGRWGCSRIGGPDWNEKRTLPEKVKSLIIFSEYIDKGQSWWFGPQAKFKWVKKWGKVVDCIGEDNKKVGIYPDATIQLIQ